ncbi:MAG: hypothetical protein AB7O65_04275 [Candidatus Korobacteraceae bacterium]
MTRIGELELSQDLNFQHRYWRFQRIGWATLAVILAAAGAGLFGTGPISHAVATSQGVKVEYSRFARRDALTRFTVRVPASKVPGNMLRIGIDSPLLKQGTIQRIEPAPERSANGRNHASFTFSLDAQSSEAAVTFEVKPQKIGRQPLNVTVERYSTIELWQFVYP